ncbi:MAG: ABC transporter ATP-binding protein [Thermofilaceae archaeon]|nr:ABC transporter ATP-binding protein [Thermofilaceae archaeon]MCX8180898.1 ABC transporter ATP-binding protein [Thermofilaceae archaeon]MDW8003463.1 ABC transporter ATP-binding protein [Thermofilaceae archaeon]
MIELETKGTLTVNEPVISIDNLTVEYVSPRGVIKAVRGVSLKVYRGETLFIVGESGSGKSTLGLAMLNIVPRPGRIAGGSITYHIDGRNVNILDLPLEDQRAFRWKNVAMVFQSALNSLNPVLRIWDQMYDTIESHDKHISREEVYEKVRRLLYLVRLDPDRVLKAYPHQLSGGMRQRVMIALALLLDPKVLILDEPTTALDLLTQKSIMEVLKNIKKELGLTMIFITHDLSLAAELADRVAVMYAGKLVELGDVYDIFYRPRHPYTFALMKTVPKLTSIDEELYPIPGSPPDMANLPPGCKFHPRCPYATRACSDVEPSEEWLTPSHLVACHRHRDLSLRVEAR